MQILINFKSPLEYIRDLNDCANPDPIYEHNPNPKPLTENQKILIKELYKDCKNALNNNYHNYKMNSIERLKWNFYRLFYHKDDPKSLYSCRDFLIKYNASCRFSYDFENFIFCNFPAELRSKLEILTDKLKQIIDKEIETKPIKQNHWFYNWLFGN